jgi:DNA-binding response OmpR family regulator
VKKSGVEVQLTGKEFDILELLLRNAGKVVHRDEFCNRIWGESVFVTERVIDSHVAALRKKIESSAGPRYVQSVRGIGYKLAQSA